MKRFGWILVLIFVPGLGLLLYWFFGSDSLLAYQKRNILKRHGAVFKQLEEIVAETNQDFEAPPSKAMLFHKKYCDSIFTCDNNIDIFTTGEDKYDSLFKDIKKAQDSIHITYFTIHNDYIGREFFDTLIKKVQQGVEVKLLYDGFGCLATFIHCDVRRLRKAGGRVYSIRPYTRNLNYRNHRKIVVIDGKIGYLGGMNIGAHYKDGAKGKFWRDAHVRVTGSVVKDLQKVFFYDWLASVKGRDIGLCHELRHYFPTPDTKGDIKAQIVANGLYNKNNEEMINLSYFNLISQAKKRVWIQTPYFRPPDTILHSLKTLAALGVDVRIMVSLGFASGGVLNRSLNRYFLRQLIHSDVKVFGYKDILHGKTMIIDDYGLCIGTVNLNIRSLEIDDEVYGYFESEKLVRKYERVFKDDLTKCIKVDEFKFEDENVISRAIESVISFLTPLS